MDITSLSIVESTTLHLAHPVSGEKLYVDAKDNLTTTETDKPVTITVASTSSRQYRTAITAMQNRKIKREREGKKLTAEIQREEGLALLTAVCLGADNLEYNGAPVSTESDFRAMLSDDGLSWIKGQIDETVGAIELFIGESLTH